MRWPLKERGEQFLVVDVLPGSKNSGKGTRARIRGALLTVDEDRHIAPVKILDDLPTHKFARMLPPRVALALHHSLLFTKEIPLELVRDPDFGKLPIDSLELENAAAQTIGKSFQEYRREAAEFFGVNEFDTALVNSVMDDFIVDGKAVELLGEPIAKRVSAKLYLQFTRRDLFDALKDAWNAPAGFSLFSREEGQLKGLKKRDGRVGALLALEREEGTDSPTVLFFTDKKTSGRVNRASLKWSQEEISEKIAAHMGVDLPVAKSIYRKYLEGNLSPRVKRSINLVIGPAVQSLKKQIAAAYHGRGLAAIPAGELPENIRVQVKDYEAVGRELAEHLGFSVDPAEWELPPHEFFGYVASFIEHYYDKNDHALNQRLQRRVHWLAPTS